MNFDIILFWENQGYIVRNNNVDYSPKLIHSMKTQLFEARKGKETRVIYFSDSATNPPTKNYFFNKSCYTEEQMLKIIKLKAFV